MIDRLRDSLRDFLRQPDLREQIPAILAELDPANAATAERDRARRHAEERAALDAEEAEEAERNRADAALDQAEAAEISQHLARIRAIQGTAAARFAARQQQLLSRAARRLALEQALRDSAPVAIAEALTAVQMLDDRLEREDRALGPASGRWILLREQRDVCAAALRELVALPLLGLAAEEAGARAATLVADVKRRCAEIGRRPVPAIDRATSQAILA